MDDVKIKQQIVEKLKASDHILVTVSDSPSVDALSAALGLSLVIHKVGKHATTIFSGAVPPAIEFLSPGKSFEENADSLRDFIIAISKDKADHIRMKVDGDMAKIYITPYHTTIKQDDLQFEDGEYGVEVVVALGVDNPDHLDRALAEHGKIFHDATIISITTGENPGDLGGINWNNKNASSLSEMVVTLAEALKDKERLIDKDSATALLTGIVAETDRFSNPKTTSTSLTVAAQLMSDGADQQLIAGELQKSQEVGEVEIAVDTPEESNTYGSSLDLSASKKETLADLDNKVRGKAEDDEALKAVEAVAPAATPAGSAYGSDEAPANNSAYGGGEITEASADSSSETPTNSAYGAPDEEEHPLDATSAPDADDQPAGAPTASAYSTYAPEDETSSSVAAPVTPVATDEGHKVIAPIHDITAEANVVASEMTSALNTPAPPAAVPAEPTPPAAPTPPTLPTPADLGLPMPPTLPTPEVTPPVASAPGSLAPSVPVPSGVPAPTPPADSSQFKIPTGP